MDSLSSHSWRVLPIRATSPPEAGFAPGADCCRNCSKSLRLRLLPVPSYLGRTLSMSKHVSMICPLLPIDGGSHEDKVRSKQSLNQGKRNSGGFVDHDELRL